MSENTLAAALTDAFDKAESETPEVESPATPEPETAEPEQIAGRTANRLRDDKGRLLPGTKDAAPQDIKPEKTVANDTPVDAPAVAAPERKAPSSWKKDYWEDFNKLDPRVAEYINQRESQFASGVSVYKDNWERAKPLQDAIAPFVQDFQAAGVTPEQGIAKLAAAHQNIVRASPEQKVQIFQRLAQEYGVTLSAVQSGQVDPMMQYVAPLQERINQLSGQLNSWEQQKQQQEQTSLQAEITAFAAENEHFEAVKEAMSGLLQSGLAKDLKSAYEHAVWTNPELRQSEIHRMSQGQNTQAVAQKARAKVISPKSATPTSNMTTSGKKDVRSILEEQVESFLGGARV
jgi:hypothetical protein